MAGSDGCKLEQRVVWPSFDEAETVGKAESWLTPPVDPRSASKDRSRFASQQPPAPHHRSFLLFATAGFLTLRLMLASPVQNRATNVIGYLLNDRRVIMTCKALAGNVNDSLSPREI